MNNKCEIVVASSTLAICLLATPVLAGAAAGEGSREGLVGKHFEDKNKCRGGT